MSNHIVSSKYQTLRADLEEKAQAFKTAFPEQKANAHEILEKAIWSYAATAMDEGGYIKYFQREEGRPQIGVYTLPERSRVRDDELRYLRAFVKALGDSKIKFSLSAVFLIHSIGAGKPTAALTSLLSLASAGFSELFREKPTEELAHILFVTETNLGRVENAERIVVECMETHPDSLLGTISRAGDLAVQGQLHAALELLNEALENSSGEKSALDDAAEKMSNELRKLLYGDGPSPEEGFGYDPL